MDFKQQLQEVTNKIGSQGLTPEESKKLQVAYTRWMAKSIRGASNLLIDLLCRYGDRQEAIIGINITPHYIRLCQMEFMFEKWTVTNLAAACIEDRFTTEDMLTHLDEYVDRLKQLIKENKIKSKNVSLSVPLSTSIVKIISLPQMSDEELSQAAGTEMFWQNLLQMSVNLHEYSISYRTIRRDDEKHTMDVLFVASRLDEINLYTEIVRRAGLNPVIVDVRCFALKNALDISAQSASDAYPSAFLELGPDENHILILDDNQIFTYPVSLSNVSLSEVMVDNFKNSDMLELFVQEYANQVRRIIVSHQNEHNAGSVKHIYVVSFLPITGTFLDKLSNLLQEYFISEYNVLQHVEVPLRLSSRVQVHENLSAWAVTMGTAMRKLSIFDYLRKDKIVRLLTSTNNLLPNSHLFIKNERIKILGKLCVAGASTTIILVAIIMSGILFTIDYGRSQTLQSMASVEETYNKKDKEFTQLTGIHKKLKSLDNIKQIIPSNQTPLLTAYRRLNEVIPEGVWLKEMEFVEPNTIRITGNAIGDQQILDFIAALNDGDGFAKVALKTMNTVDDNKLYRRSVQIKNFTLEGSVKDMPLPPEPVKPAAAPAAAKPTAKTQ